MLRRSTRWVVTPVFRVIPLLRATLFCCALLISGAPSFGIERLTVNFDYVAGRAKELAEKPYDPNWGRIPDYLQKLNYDAYQDIRFDPLRALWSEDALPFQIRFHHPGGLYQRAVRIHEFTESHVQEIRFDKDLFNYGKQDGLRERIPASLGYAGFSVFFPINKAGVFDSFATFLGSNYFRIVGRDEAFGLSARALALDTTIGQEEFPAFREYWLGKPAPQAETLEIYGLMDGPSVTGAYRFELRPGKETAVAVRATLYLRQSVRQVGLAPLSSMFLYGENSLAHPPDYRPEVHDSDGLLIALPEGRRLWRPLDNPTSGSQVAQWRFEKPVAFGLMQRDRAFGDYQDIGAAYHKRPNVWIEPGAWGPGQVTLYEFSSRFEAVDNIVSFWQPESCPAVGQPYAFQYTLHVGSDEPTSGGLVIATRTGRDIIQPELYECVVDFDGTELRTLKEVDAVKPVIEDDMGGKLERATLTKNPFNDTWRLVLKFHPPDPHGSHELRAFLEHDGKPITETWSYRWMKNLPN